MPWLQSLAEHIVHWQSLGGAVLACSALKESYRGILSSNGASQVTFVYLSGTKALIWERMKQRIGHYMPPTLLDSQFATLEPPIDAILESIENPPEIIANNIMGKIGKSL
jgi:carbohydrate kinase (thermoresistant glucokinase family)